MTSTTTTTDATTEPPSYPMPRAARCPFDPSPDLMAEQAASPLTRVTLWDGSTPWLVTRYAEQKALLGDPRVSSDVDRPGFPLSAPRDPGSRGGVGFILMDDPEHARLRRMVTAPFATKKVAALRPAIQRIVDDLIDEMLAGPKPVDLVQAFALPVPSLVICELLGVPYTDHEFFQQNSNVLVSLTPTPKERGEAVRRLTDYLHDLIGTKLHRPADDLLTGLAERVRAGEITQLEAAQIGVLLLVAGHETTANMIALGTLALLEHPEQLARLRDTGDETLAASAVEELLRYLNITHGGRRRVATEDIEVGDVTIRAGEGIVLPNEIANRDETMFPDAATLDLSRDARRHVAFGFGVHQCLGQGLARVELKVVYSTLYRRIPSLRLATDLDSLSFKTEGVVYGVHELPVTW
ncbi:cytochrome P450 [Myceligenerans indicum]|uniref:Cytochrome P450 n=1 Tax=Myceligenerans indicum TaxID=2593663 RepID=A0ABS1LJY4_9MICO|nr:cytochrome P450 [Myceligenerans indicum]MBL0886542.1 cytochrome P450 [Myceligenerans indicum]